MRAIVLLGLVACGDVETSAIAQHGACTALEGKVFVSVTEHECGLGPNGPEACHWHLVIDVGDGTSSEMMWTYSDVGQTLRVACDGPAITSVAPSYRGTFDPMSATLTWDGIDYAE